MYFLCKTLSKPSLDTHSSTQGRGRHLVYPVFSNNDRSLDHNNPDHTLKDPPKESVRKRFDSKRFSFRLSRFEKERGGEKEIATLSDYATVGDSVSLAKLGDKAFTIIHVEDSEYRQGEEVTEGVKITTKEAFQVDGIVDPQSKFHTSRVAVTRKLKQAQLREDINSGKVALTVKCVSAKAANGKSFFNLVDA